MRWLTLFTLCFALLTTPTQANDSRLTFATLNWAPYAGKSLYGYGISSAIIKAACNRVGLEADFHFVPWTRAMKETQVGKYDALYNAYFSEQRAEDYAVSEPYFKTTLVLCVKKNKDIHYDGTTASLHPYRLGVVRGYVNTEAIDNDSKIIKDEAENDVLNLNKLLHGRVDVITIDRYQALHLVKNNPTIEADVGDIKFLSPKLASKDLHVMFSKNKSGWEEKLKLFNRGLDAIKKDGTLNELMIIYGISVTYD